MRFDLFWVLDHYPETGEASSDVVARVLDETVAAEQLGFDGCWYAEHHFTPYGVCPSPPVLLAAAAARTTRIRLGAAVSVLPFAHPVHTAEAFALVDVVSKGRLDLGVGSGYLAQEYEGFAIAFADKRQRFDEAFAFLLDLWQGRRVEHSGPHFPSPPVTLNVEPVQRPHPPVWVAVVRPDSVRPVARKGFPIMMIPYAHNMRDQHLHLFADAYRSAAPDDRHSGLATAYHALVGPSTEEAQATVLPYLRRFIATRTQHMGGSADEMLANDLVIVGDPAACIDRIRRLAQSGVTHLLLMMSFGGMPAAVVARSLHLFATEVIPAFAASGLRPRARSLTTPAEALPIAPTV